MPKLPSRKPREIAKFLQSKGFLLDHVSGSHFIFYHPGSRRRAVVPIHQGDLPKGTLLSILREAGFTRKDIVRDF